MLHVLRRGGRLRGRSAAGLSTRPLTERPADSSIPKGTPRSIGHEKKTQDEVKLIIQPDDGVAPVVQAIHKATKTDRHRHLPLRPRRGREGARRGGRARRRRPRPDRPYQQGRREEPAQARAAAARGRRHRGAHGRRPGALPRQDDDRRRRALHVYGFNYTQPRHRAEPQLRHRHPRQADGAGGGAAVRGGRDAPAVHAGAPAPGGQPGNSRALLTAFIKGARKRAADLRRPGQRQRDPEAAGRARARPASRSGSSAASRRQSPA